MPKHIALVGMMGSGKSTVAPLVAAALKRPIIEVDELIEKHEGMPIGEIFIAKGEAHFRKVEAQIIFGLLNTPPAVLSLGGGAFQWEATRELLLKNTVAFYLAASEQVLVSRLETGRASRPLISIPGLDLRMTIRDLLALRDRNYSLAHYRIDTDNHTPPDVVKAITMMREAYE